MSLKKSFRPKILYTPTIVPDNDSNLTTESNSEVKINIEELENTVIFLRKYHNVLIKNLQGEALDKFEYLINLVMILHNLEYNSILSPY